MTKLKINKIIFIISIFFLLVIFILPAFSSNSESLANKFLIVNGNKTTAKLSQLIYYVEQDQLKFPDLEKTIKWVTNKKYISDENIIVEDSLMNSIKNEQPEFLLGYEFYLKKDPNKTDSIILDKLLKTGGKDTNDINGENLEVFVITAQKNNFQLPSEYKRVANNTQNNRNNTVSNNSLVTNNTDNKKEPLSFFDYLKIGGVITIILAVLFVFYGFSSSCPSCRKWFAEELIDKEELGRRNSYKTVRDTVTHKDKNGAITGTSTTEKQVPITLIEYKNYYKCSYCDYEWSKVTEEEKN